MQRLSACAVAVAALVSALCASSAQAQMPVPTSATPTLRGGQTMDGIAVSAEVGYPALRVGAYFGSASAFDVGVELSAPTFGEADLNGYFQNVGMDVRVPLRFRLLDTSKLVGSLRVAPLFHVGRPAGVCARRGARCDPNLGMGATIGFIMDIPLPKLFKLIIGPDTRWGFVHFGRDRNRFAGATMINVGLEALWQQFFFTLIMHVGASYISGPVGRGHRAEPLFRQLAGFGYHF